MVLAQFMQLLTGIFEGILGIPGLGALIIIGNSWVPLIIMLVLHIITLYLASTSGRWIAGSVLGIVASILGFIPFVGMVLHWAACIVLIICAFQSNRVNSRY